MDQISFETGKKINALTIKVALVFSIYTLVTIYILKTVGIDSFNISSPIINKIIIFIFSYGIFIMAIFFVQFSLKKKLGNYISYNNAFSAGFKVAAYSGLIIGILYAICFKILEPSAIDKITNITIEKDQQIKGIIALKPFKWIYASFTAAISYASFGFFISLATASILRADRPLKEL